MTSIPPTRGARARALMALAKKIVLTETELHEDYPQDKINQALADLTATQSELAPYLDAYNDNPVWDMSEVRPGNTIDWEEEALAAVRSERRALQRTADALAHLEADPATDWASLAVMTGIPADALRARAAKPRDSRLNTPGTVTVAEAARLLNTPRTTVAHWVKTGRVTTTESTSGRTLVVVDQEGFPILTD